MGEFAKACPSMLRLITVPSKMSPYFSCFIFLTKRPENLSKWSPFPPNTYIGVSVTNQLQYDNAVKYLAMVEAPVKFLSLEPLLNHIRILGADFSLLQWIICGQQTPVSQTTMPELGWIEDIVVASDKASVPVFLKDNLRNIIATELYQCGWAVGERGDLRQEFPRLAEGVRTK